MSTKYLSYSIECFSGTRYVASLCENGKVRDISLDALDPSSDYTTYSPAQLLSHPSIRGRLNATRFRDILVVAKCLPRQKSDDILPAKITSSDKRVNEILQLLDRAQAEFQFFGDVSSEGLKIALEGTWNEEDKVRPAVRDIAPILQHLDGRLSQILAVEEADERRLANIESPIAQMLCDCEVRGVRLDTNQLQEFIEIAETESARTGARLRKDFDIYNVYDEAGIKAQLGRLQTHVPLSVLTGWSISSALRILAPANIFFKLLLDHKKAVRERRVLLQLYASGDRVYPYYDSFGTITGRIMLGSPPLQYLKKKHRTVISSDEGYSLIYCDYGQCEAGIMAYLSGDAGLLSMFNGGDLYSDLSRQIFGSKEMRKEAKRLFLAYSYGMSKSGLAFLVTQSHPGISRDSASHAIDLFFDQFRRLETWSGELGSELLRTGRIGSVEGNFRRRSSTSDSLTKKEKRWVLSQRVQGTSSLIFKEALLGSVTEKIQLLVPLHDGALFQIETGFLSKGKERILSAFSRAMSNRCPGIVPKVNFPSFMES